MIMEAEDAGRNVMTNHVVVFDKLKLTNCFKSFMDFLKIIVVLCQIIVLLLLNSVCYTCIYHITDISVLIPVRYFRVVFAPSFHLPAI